MGCSHAGEWWALEEVECALCGEITEGDVAYCDCDDRGHWTCSYCGADNDGNGIGR